MKDLNAEASILSAMLLGDRSISKAINLINEEDFYLTRHKQMFRAIVRMYQKNEPVDIVTLGSKGIDKEFLNEVSDIVLSDTNLAAHAKIVKDHSIRRRLRIIGDHLLKVSVNSDPVEVIGEAQTQLMSALGTDKKSFYNAEEAVMLTLDYMENTKKEKHSVKTGISEFDRMVFMQPGELTVIGGISSSGKSAFAHQIGFYNSRYYGKKVGFINMEMGKEQIIMREKSFMSRVPISKLMKSWEMTEEEMAAVIDAGNNLSLSSFRVDDSKRQTTTTIKAKLQEMKYDMGGLDIIVIDYLQLIRGNSKLSKRELVSQNVEDLKAIAGELNAHVIAISSMKRKHDSVKDHRPTLNDFKETGDIEYTADICIGLWLDYKDQDVDVENGLATYRILKQRNGLTCERNFLFIPDLVHFVDSDQKLLEEK